MYKEAEFLCKWLFDTDINPYGLFHDDDWAESFDSAERFSSLCNEIYHAITDDGDISYVVVNKSPRIAFKHECDIKKIEDCARENEISSFKITAHLRKISDKENFKDNLEFYFLKDAYEFVDAVEKYELDWKRTAFRFDAKRSLTKALNDDTYPSDLAKKWANELFVEGKL